MLKLNKNWLILFRLLVIAPFLLLLMGVIGYGVVTILSKDESVMNEEDIAAYLGIPFPDHMTDFTFDAKQGRLFYIRFEFKAEPETVEEFANHFCNGVLHQGFDPFDLHLLPFPQPLSSSPNIVLIKERNATYYAYSSSANDDLFGNRCLSEKGHIQNILIDQSNPDHYRVQYETPFDELNSGGNKNYVQPLNDFPLMLIGVQETDVYTIVTNEICLELGAGYYNVPEVWEPIKYLENGNVQVYFDDVLVDTAQIVDDEGGRGFRLIPVDRKSNDYRFNLCWLRNKEPVQMRVEIVSVAGDKIIEMWQLYSSDSPH